MARNADVLVFETVHEKQLSESLNELHFYTWGDEECCLPRGATSATLVGHAEGLARGDLLVFVERKSPTRLSEEDADRKHRHPVRLTRVEFTVDPSGKLFGPEAVDEPAPITRIEWDPSDALPFSLCISVAEEPRVSVALGNIVLVEHGEVQPVDDLPPVPAERKFYARRTHQVGDCCDPPEPLRLPLRYRPALRDLPLCARIPPCRIAETTGGCPAGFLERGGAARAGPARRHAAGAEAHRQGERPGR